MTENSVLIRGGLVFDGVSPDGAVRDVVLTRGRIAEVGPHITGRAARIVDAAGAWVMPGFVDAHSHGDLAVLSGQTMEGRALAGVTTEVVGQDGLGLAPAEGVAAEMMTEVLAPIVGTDRATTWPTVTAYLGDVDRGAYARVATLAPHGALRAAVAGRAARPLTSAERDQLALLVENAVADGAVGLSTGLSYPPALWSDTAELVAATRALPGGLPYVTHLRDYGAGFDGALREALDVGARSECPVHLSHFHISGPGRAAGASAYLDLLDRAADRGVRLTLDSYPYVHACTFLTTVLPPRLQALPTADLLAELRDPEGARTASAEIDAAGTGATVAAGWEGLLLAGLDGTAFGAWDGRSVATVAAESGRTPGQIVAEVIVGVAGQACVLVEQGHLDNITRIASHPAQVGGSDGIPGCGVPHPRAAGTFLRFLRWARDGVLPVPVGETIARMTSRSAAVFGLDTGRLVPGAHADVLVVDPDALSDGPDTGPFTPTAVRHSFLAGEAVIDDGRWLAPRLPGLALRGPRR